VKVLCITNFAKKNHIVGSEPQTSGLEASKLMITPRNNCIRSTAYVCIKTMQWL